jgi:hypothetical protein
LSFKDSQTSRNTQVAMNDPALRGHAWIDVEQRQNMGGILMYGVTAEDDWNGPRSRRQR